MKPSARDYAQALYELRDEDGHVDVAVLKRFLDRLVRDNNHDLLPVILEELDTFSQKQRGSLVVTVVTAMALTADQRLEIEKALNASHPKQHIELVEEIDPGLIGGVVLRIGDRLIDHSIKGKLDALIERLD